MQLNPITVIKTDTSLLRFFINNEDVGVTEDFIDDNKVSDSRDSDWLSEQYKRTY